ncbi:hypothetical protein D3C83_54680 [compost metagenome]
MAPLPDSASITGPFVVVPPVTPPVVEVQLTASAPAPERLTPLAVTVVVPVFVLRTVSAPLEL